MIFQIFSDNGSAVEFRSASSRYCCALAVATSDYPGDTSGGVFCFNSVNLPVFGKEAFTLGQSHRVGLHRFDFF
jgi:hypothetical protein